MSSAQPAPSTTATKKDRTHYLYLAVIGAVLLGIAVGFAFPAFAVALKPLGTAFVALIKMMIELVIFRTIVLGVGSVGSAARVGRWVGSRWPTSSPCRPLPCRSGWSSALIKPGEGLNLTRRSPPRARRRQAGASSPPSS